MLEFKLLKCSCQIKKFLYQYHEGSAKINFCFYLEKLIHYFFILYKSINLLPNIYIFHCLMISVCYCLQSWRPWKWKSNRSCQKGGILIASTVDFLFLLLWFLGFLFSIQSIKCQMNFLTFFLFKESGVLVPLRTLFRVQDNKKVKLTESFYCE